MTKYWFLMAAFLLGAGPCAAQFKDDAQAKAALGGKTAKQRLEAIQYFGAQRSQAAYAALTSHFSSEQDAYLRVQIVEALDVKGSTWAYACAEKAAADANPAVRQAAASAISGKTGDAAADKKLKALAADSSEAVRLAVVHSLSLQPSTSAVTIIGGVLADRKGTLKARRAAAEALAGMKTQAGDSELLKHLSDADPQIKAAAASRKPSKKKPAKKE